ncbi:zinc knuckle [Teladorsagia circumcincta]|uniref:Zinc knuckle n=1 Tax=Teladorsagia circumcincta TaxID=45464 RepID=A0A2G9UJI1_TELCI|nr:zinc knuckle [Teladorsagia circumcincta]
MEKHFQPKKLVLAERFGLMSKVQKPGQSLQEYYAELQRAANGCQFEAIRNHRDAMVTMVFIGGLQSLDTRKGLLEKEDLTSKEALEQAEAWERVGVNAPHLNEGPQPLGIAQVRPKGVPKQGRPGKSQAGDRNAKRPGKGPVRERASCNVCGKLGHFGNECFRKERAFCKVCSKRGHLTHACRRAVVKEKDSRKVHWCVEPPGSSDGDEGEGSDTDNTIFAVSQCHRRRARRPVSNDEGGQESKRRLLRYPGRGVKQLRCQLMGEQNSRVSASVYGNKSYGELAALSVEPPRMLRIRIGGYEVPFELDTGASMSIIDEKSWRTIGAPKLKKSCVEATAYNNERIRLQGQLEAAAEFAGNKAIMKIHVFKQASHPLCGRDMIKALQIDCGPYYNQVHSLQEMSQVQLKSQIVRLLQENKELFEGGLGKCTSFKATLKFKDKPMPKFFRARPVAIALRQKVDAKLQD